MSSVPDSQMTGCSRLLRHPTELAAAIQGKLPGFGIILREEEIEVVSSTLALPSN